MRKNQNPNVKGYLMLLEYIQAALRRAKYEILTDDGIYYGEVPGCQGVYAQATTLEACREDQGRYWKSGSCFGFINIYPYPSSMVLNSW
jgi:hypothetical protein